MSTKFPDIVTTVIISDKVQGLTFTSFADLDAESDSSNTLRSSLSPTANTGIESPSPFPAITVRKKSAVAEHTDVSPKKGV